jgi:ABC-2 type transport system permease protein
VKNQDINDTNENEVLISNEEADSGMDLKSDSAGDMKRDKKGRLIADRRNRTLKMISVSSAILFVAVIMLFNAVFDSLIGKNLKWDLTQTSIYSIGEVSKELLDGLEKDVQIVGLYEKGTRVEYVPIELLLDDYVKYSNGRVSVHYIDPIRTPSIITQLDPDDLLKPSASNFVVRCEVTEKAKVLLPADLFKMEFNQMTWEQEVTGYIAEQGFSGAILYTVSEETPVVYMTKGHGEADYTENYKTVISILQDNNFLVKNLDLLTTETVPEDAELLIMLSPSVDIAVKSKDMIDKFLRTGKSLLVVTQFSNTSYPVLNTLLAEYNIELSDHRIREGDRERRFGDDPYIFLADAPVNFFTQEAVDAKTYVRNVRAVTELKNVKEWVQVQPVFQTGEQGVVEQGGIPENTLGSQVATIGLATLHTGFVSPDPTKVMVLGTSDYMSDAILETFGLQVYNIYSFYHSINWLINIEGDQLLIAPKPLPSYQLTKGNNTWFWVATIVCIIVIPLGLMIAALIVYRKRKNL